MLPLRLATRPDVPRCAALIDRSVRAVGAGYYTSAQIESAVRYVFGPDTQLIDDGTYFVIESDAGELIAAGGWSRRRTLYGGDQMKPAEDPLLDPATEPAHPRVLRSPRLGTQRTGTANSSSGARPTRRAPVSAHGTDGDASRRTALPRARIRAGRADDRHTSRRRSIRARAHDTSASVSVVIIAPRDDR